VNGAVASNPLQVVLNGRLVPIELSGPGYVKRKIKSNVPLFVAV